MKIYKIQSILIIRDVSLRLYNGFNHWHIVCLSICQPEL